MNGTETGATTRMHGVWRVFGRRLASALAVAVSMFAVGAAVLAPPAAARAGALAGTWSSVDTDGSNQTLEINGAGNPVYAVFLRDDATSAICGGAPAQLTGTGVAEGEGLFVLGTLVCLPGGNPIPRERIFLSFEYDAGTDTLTDNFGVVWQRAG